jgi:hypothetical protein
MMDCPKCSIQLVWEDWFGIGPHIEDRPKAGDIYRCETEECDPHFYYTYASRPDELHEGYPC